MGTRMLAEELLDLDDHHELHLHVSNRVCCA